ncbi:hypothetical protein Leryth_026776 [Lithospermum erythrorhizon]|nr:hypothetical protein Leryth_026776 [Lithospermum erythrorhizon]
MASLPLACTLTPSSNLKQSHKIVSNPTSTLFNFPSSTCTNKPVHLNGFRVSANAKDGSVGVATVHRKKRGSEAYKEVAKEIKDARKTRDEQWKMALETLLFQIKNIRRKIETHFMDKQDVANPLLVILKDVESLVEIHKVNIGLKNPIPTTDAMMTVANHFQAYKHSERDDGVIPVDPRPKRNAFSPMIDMFTEVANLLYGQRGAQVYLQGNFAPVREETPPTEIQVVEGELPSCIKGMMIRNGPNPQFEPLAKYQWMDGDGMLHIHTSRWESDIRIALYHFIDLSRAITGQAEFPKYGDYTGAFGVFTAFTQLLKSIFVLDTSYGCGVANESIAYHAGMVMKDPKTGEWFVFGAAYTEPYMTYRVVAPDGSISDPLPIEVSGPTYMHDFCITDNYVIIMDLPLTFNPEAMLKYNDWIYNLNPLKKARFGIRPRDPKINAEVQWFEFEDPFFIFHNANSWEDGDDKVVLYGCKIRKVKMTVHIVCRYVGALVEATQEIVSENKIDYPKINENYRTGKSRYVYANEFDNTGKSPAILKYDLEAEPKKRVTRADFGGNIFGSEVVFIPSENATEEDDGYLLNYVHDEDNGKSYVNVICANEMKKVAALELPNRVPYGFHAIFIDEDDLEHQRTL